MLDSLLSLLHRIEFQWVWLGLLLPLPLLMRWLPAPGLADSHSVRVPNLPNLLVDTPLSVAPVPNTYRRWLYALIWCCLVLAATRPQLLMPASAQEVAVRDLVLVLDVSGSMATEDMYDSQGVAISRLAAMQAAVRAFIQAREDDNIGLVVFGSQAYPFAPLSRDRRVLLERVDELRAAMAGPQTSIGDALGSTLKMLRNQTSTSASPTDMERMIVLLTDGKDTASTLPPEVALRLAKKLNVIIHTIALGGDREDTVNLPLLRKIANDTGGTFHLATQDAQSLQAIYATVDRITPRKVKQAGWSYRQPLYLYPLSVALCGLGLMMVGLRRAGRTHG